MPRKQAVLSLTLVMGSLLASLTVVEFTGRATGLWRPSRMFRYHPSRGYALTPNVGDVNDLGFRGPSVDPRHHAGTIRIIVLGDSFTYGDGVAASDALPAQLERDLNQRAAAPRYEVLNLGVPGYNTAQEVAYFEEAGLALHPDMIILAFNLSDADLGAFGLHSPGHELVVRVKEFLKAHVGLYDFVRLRIRTAQAWSFHDDPATAVWPEMYPLRLAARGEPSPGWVRCRTALKTLAAECRHAGVPMMLIVWPVLERLEDYPYRREHEFVAAQAAALHIPSMDLLPLFANGDARALTVSERNPHPNAVAHRRAAAVLAAFLGASTMQHSGS